MSDSANRRPEDANPAAVAMERLLAAERAGEDFLAEAKRAASQRVEDAYKAAQAIDRRCSERIEKLNRACGDSNDRLVQAIEAEAKAVGSKSTDVADMRTAMRAVASKLAARLTGEDS